MKKKIVISATNLVEGGTLSILKDCLASTKYLAHEYEIIALVHDKKKLGNIYDHIKFIELPKAKKGWLLRIYYEYIYFKKLSKELQPYLWFSLHDMTPNVIADKQVVYCHNSSPFYKSTSLDYKFDKKFFLFTLFYKYLYKINIKKNKYVIVQQQWIRNEFSKMYGLSEDKIIVAIPKFEFNDLKELDNLNYTNKKTYIYPAFPRTFKNFEYIGEAMKILEKKNHNIEINLTIDGSENKYAAYIVEKYKDVKGVNFIGLKSRAEIFEYYKTVTGLIFPSKLETWGLPLSEFAMTNKEIYVADLPYAKETLNDYENAIYFDVNNPAELSNLLLDTNLTFRKFSIEINSPVTHSWETLFKTILER